MLMKILVAIKKALDSSVRVRVSPTGKYVELTKLSLNPFCETALEAAVRVKENRKSLPTEVVAVSCGTLNLCEETLRSALALGADRGIAVDSGALRLDTELQPLAVAKLIEYVAHEERPNLILCGKQAIDSDSCQTGQMLAALLDWNQATFISALSISADCSRVCVKREVETGIDRLDMTLPAVLSCDLRLNKPRFVSLPKLMKDRTAKKAPIQVFQSSSMNVDCQPSAIVQRIEESCKARHGRLVSSVDELVTTLTSNLELTK